MLIYSGVFDQEPLKFVKYTLPNGLSIVIPVNGTCIFLRIYS